MRRRGWCLAWAWLLFMGGPWTYQAPAQMHVQAFASKKHKPTFVIVFSAECNSYMDWQSLSLIYSHRRVKQRERIVRLLACDDSSYEHYNLTSRFPNAETFVHPPHPKRNEYAPYNKPYSIYLWLQQREPKEDYIIFLDADVIIYNRITIEALLDLGLQRGSPLSGKARFMKGLENERIELKGSVPNSEKAQKVGGFYIMHHKDMKKVAGMWLHYTDEMRNNPKNWDAGDDFNLKGKRAPWVAEMYGYSFACAHFNLVHKYEFQAFPKLFSPSEPFPLTVHYAWTFNIDTYGFGKKHFHKMIGCPVQNIDFPLKMEEIDYLKSEKEFHWGLVIALKTVQTIYDALEDYQISVCRLPPSAPFRRLYMSKDMNNGKEGFGMKLAGMDLEREIQANRERSFKCEDKSTKCCHEAKQGKCDLNPEYMLVELACQKSCSLCGHSSSCRPKLNLEDINDVGRVIGLEPVGDLDDKASFESVSASGSFAGNLRGGGHKSTRAPHLSFKFMGMVAFLFTFFIGFRYILRRHSKVLKSKGHSKFSKDEY